MQEYRAAYELDTKNPLYQKAYHHLAPSQGQDHKVRISITASSNVSTSEIGKTLDTRCPDVTITVDPQKADYLLQAIYTGAGPARNPYKFTLFNRAGDRVFSTETARLSSATKDVCNFIRKTSGAP